MVHAVRECLVSSVEDTIRDGRHIAVLLSGGLDSSVIAGIIADLQTRGVWPAQAADAIDAVPHSNITCSVQCFTLAFDDERYDESGEESFRTSIPAP